MQLQIYEDKWTKRQQNNDPNTGINIRMNDP